MRTATSRLLGVAIALTGGAVAARWWDTPRARIPVLQSAFPVVGIVAGALLLLALLLRGRRLAVAAALVACVPAVLGVRAALPDTVDAGPRDEVVMVSNLEIGSADAASVVRAVREQRVTSLVLVEVTPDAADRLRTAGLEKLLPYAVGSPQQGAEGTVIRSRHPLTTLHSAHVSRRFDQPVARVHADEGAYVLRAVHPYPPVPDLVASWHRQLGELAAWRDAQPADEPLVMAGDFNASAAHPAFRRVVRTMTDAHRATGAGWVRTWPQGHTLPPFVQLDHVLVRRLGVVDAGVEEIDGTDHAAAWARLRVG
ncbi:endonuclease/exonuclease/phosphatase family protein [Luteipulveratus flavus]|uniref:Endonuclease/exonuclease/phosphatase family protein n=1 Tax=Luteipulveratus flavus TaxID=3031728 RepID=A0ABT6CB85_9MICO|nr:endonuclease/exonuclease/phosphatase family protein [Luteipulveratus sp. YIM 133296]MDF8265314.1 endonuclease/exonuclease/phosphatase family protein [Luteipulveratus sp. YIM 133296]